ncbi:MAG: non-canonical purine NTP pyrophosphatase [Candidatus Woesearchaeota archaeon]
MGIKESLKKLQEQEQLDKRLSLKREVKKELTKLKREKISAKKCIECGETAKYSIKGSSDWYCKGCAIEYFGDLKNLKKTSIDGMNKDKPGTKIYFITNNDKKFLEISKILPQVEQLKLELEEIQELDAKRIIEHKLLEAKKRSHDKLSAFIVEDTSLYLECINGLPGPLIKWFLQTLGNEGLYRLALKSKNNRAEARTIIGYYSKEKIRYFQGIVKGKIVHPRSGEFGWDAIFLPEDHDKVMGEMTHEEKNAISMRGKAAIQLKEYLSKK